LKMSYYAHSWYVHARLQVFECSGHDRQLSWKSIYVG